MVYCRSVSNPAHSPNTSMGLLIDFSGVYISRNELNLHVNSIILIRWDDTCSVEKYSDD